MDETKKRFAQALRALMQDNPFDKISVITIAQEAGLSRKAFYNHFRDKYDLLNWICYSQFVQVHNQTLQGGGWGAFKSFLEFFASDRHFFAESLRDMSQNSFGQYFSDLLYEIVYETTYKGFRSTMTSEKWIGLSVAALVEDARLAIVIWLLESEDPDPEELLNLLVSASDAYCSMLCLERAARTGESMCDHAIETLSRNWVPDMESIEVKLPKPDDPTARRRAFERYMPHSL